MHAQVFTGDMSKLYHLDAWVYVYPRDGIWSRQPFDEIRMACSYIPSLREMSPIGSHYGFRFDQTNGVRSFQKTIPNASTFDLGADIRIVDFKFQFRGTDRYVNCIQLLAKYGASREQMVDLARVFQDAGHIILGAHGVFCQFETITLKKAESEGLELHHRKRLRVR